MYTARAQAGSIVMTTWIKIGANCIVVAALTIGGIFAFASLPEFTLKTLKWAGEQLDEAAYLALYFFQSVVLWAVVGGIIALAMLLLRPRRVILYGTVSAAAFIVFGQSWMLDANAIWIVRELIFAATIPLLYWLFVQLARKKHQRSSRSDGGDTDSEKFKRQTTRI